MDYKYITCERNNLSHCEIEKNAAKAETIALPVVCKDW